MKTLKLIAVLLALSSSVFSQIIVLNSFPAPTTSCGDLAFDGQNLWIGGQYEYELYQISTIDGSILRTIPTLMNSPYGLTFDGTDLWIADTVNDSIQKIDTLNGNIISIYHSPKSTPSRPLGLAWDGTNLWYNDIGEFNGSFLNYLFDSTFVLDPMTGNAIQGHSSIGQGPTGLGYGGGYLFSADSETDQIYIIDPSDYSVLDSFPTVGGSHPNGLAWDGEYLWLANNESDSIYQLDVSAIISSIPERKDPDIDVSLYPNPSSEYLIVELHTFETPYFEVFDTNGRSIFLANKAISSNSYSLDLSDLELGAYLLSIHIGNKRTTKLFLKN